MRSILLHIADDDGLEPRMQAALDLARAFDAHLTCLQAISYEYAMPGDFYGSLVAQLVPVMREAAEKTRARCEERLANEDVVWSWELEDGRAIEHLLRRGSLSDVVVLGSREPAGNRPSALAQDFVMRANAPALIVPEHSTGLDCMGTALVAWNGSAEAAHALRAAVPLLSKSASVVLASVTGEPDRRFDLPAVEGAEYLARHGITCEMIEFPLQGKSVSDVLAQAAAMRKASYLVMGAYGHSRLAEMVLGGVTRDFFGKPPLPIFACH